MKNGLIWLSPGVIFPVEDLFVFDSYAIRNPASHPVKHSLSSMLLVEAKQSRDFRWPAKGNNQVFVAHVAITHHV